MRLRNAELAEPLRGTLSLYDWSTDNSFGRPVRCMEVKKRVGTLMQAQATLFEPELLAVAGLAMSFRGIELKAIGGRLFEHEQVWRVVLSGVTLEE